MTENYSKNINVRIGRYEEEALEIIAKRYNLRPSEAIRKALGYWATDINFNKENNNASN